MTLAGRGRGRGRCHLTAMALSVCDKADVILISLEFLDSLETVRINRR